MTTTAAEPQAKLLTIDEFMAMPDSRGYELIEGVLRERRDMGAGKLHRNADRGATGWLLQNTSCRLCI